MSKVIQEYMNKIYSLVIILVTGSTTCAAVTFAALKMLGFYPDVSWIALGIFLGTCTAYLTIGIILIRISYEKDADGNKNLKPKMLKVGKIFVLVLLAIQYNFIYYMIPTREFWAYVFYFAILAAFFLDIKVVVISIFESFASLIVVSIVRSDVVLPIKDSIFIAELVLRIVGATLCLFAVFLMCLLINRYLVDMKKDEIESNNARVQKVLSTAQALSEKLLKAGTVLSKISSNETTTAQELASTGEALLADSNALRK